MFQLYHHHDLDRLAELLSVLLSRRNRQHALEPDTVIVPNRGVGRWLQMRLAESDGIAANIEFPLLARFIWDQVPALLPGRPTSPDFERDRMRWHLYAVLPEVAKENDAVTHYLEASPPDIHRLQLADRLADVFDQYLIYRPSLLAGWEQGKIAETSPESWQARVWLALTRRLGAEHRARLLARFAERAANGALENTDRLPGSVCCFGLSQIPPEYVKFLYGLGQLTDVHFLLPNPCEGYWGDIRGQRLKIEEFPGTDAPEGEALLERDHPLLGSLGRGTRDLLRVLYSDELTAIHEPELGEALAYKAPDGNGLLARLQAGILRMAAPPEDSGMEPEDVSVQVHSCHGPLREVQVLQDQLLDLLGRDPELTPRDILVMMPNVSTYAPAIRSVFGAAEGRRHLRYSISDQARSTSHPTVQSFQRLLDLPLSRWPASEILALAAVPPIARRFGLDESSLDSVRSWTQAAGVRWGFDAETRERFGAGAFAQNTWRFGLDRLLLGFAQSDEETLVDGVAPWSDLEGGAAAALGSLWQLIEQLRTWEQTLQEPAPARTWQDRLNAMVDALFAPKDGDSHEAAALDEIRQSIAVLGEAADCLGEEPLGWQAVREALAAELSLPGKRQPFLSGGITFCGLTPLRAVPFKVICLLGMNDSDFPRQDADRAFNLLRARPRIGDYSVREDDRLMFLQALMAARDVFYISYTGQDVASGEELPPSPVVGEWLDFLHVHYFNGHTREAFQARLVTRQPMHPFSARYFETEPEHPRLFTFAREWEPGSRAGEHERVTAPVFAAKDVALPETVEDAGIIDLADLHRFFDDPPRYFLRGRLGIRLDSDEDEPEDAEPLDLGPLHRHTLRSELFERARRSALSVVPTAPDTLWRARGVLPPPPLDHPPFEKEASVVNQLLPIWREWARDGEAGEHLDLDVAVGDQRLVGRLSGVWPDGPRLLRAGKLRMQYKLRSWIDYLAYLAAGHEGVLRLAGLDPSSSAVTQYEAVSEAEAARAHLATLIEIYRRGQREPLLFLPDLAESYLGGLITRGQSGATALESVNSRLTNDYQPSHHAKDPYFSRLFLAEQPLGISPDDSPFCKLAEAICEPPFRAMEEV